MNLLLPSLVFLSSAVVALFSATLGMTMWFLLIPVYIYRRVTETSLPDGGPH